MTTTDIIATLNIFFLSFPLFPSFYSKFGRITGVYYCTPFHVQSLVFIVALISVVLRLFIVFFIFFVFFTLYSFIFCHLNLPLVSYCDIVWISITCFSSCRSRGMMVFMVNGRTAFPFLHSLSTTIVFVTAFNSNTLYDFFASSSDLFFLSSP